MNPECERGRHGELRAEPPSINDAYVNVDYVCTVCGLIVQSSSWTRMAWDMQHNKVEVIE